jgi:Ferritin-like domain
MTSKIDSTRDPDASASLRPDTEHQRFEQDDVQTEWRRVVGRRSFLKGVGLAGAAAVPGSALFASQAMARSAALTNGDVAILRFLAAAELIESDLWQQYNELGGVNGGNPAYIAALSNLDSDMPQYIADNTDDEESHAAFLNAYLRSKGAEPVNLDEFRTLPSSKATGAKQKGRLTNLQSLNVDTSWYVRYRSTKNPDLGATFPQAVNIRREPAIPLNDNDTPPHLPAPVPPVGPQETRMQAIANTAGFHFAFIEQGGSSLYSIMALKATSLEVLRIIVSIGGVETNHFSLWHDKAGNAVAQPLAGVTDPQTGVTFPDLNAKGGELNQTNLILPEPCEFLHKSLPQVSIVRPTLDRLGGAVAAINGFTADRLFEGHSSKFFQTVHRLAREADTAQRHLG